VPQLRRRFGAGTQPARQTGAQAFRQPPSTAYSSVCRTYEGGDLVMQIIP